jgi:hypothetical protein
MMLARVMAEPTPLDRCPARLRIGPGPPDRVYVRQEDYYALHGGTPGAPAPGAELVLKGGEIAVFRASPPAGATERVGPVYATDDGPLAVPTGLLFVRFTPSTRAADRRRSLEDAGFDVVQLPGYAPHACWVRPRAGGIAAALHGVTRLAALPGVEHVEPQLLTARGART